MLLVGHGMAEDTSKATYVLTDGLTYGADFHRYRQYDSGNAGHEHGDALVLVVPHDVNTAESSCVVTWFDVLCVARVASLTGKALALTSALTSDTKTTTFANLRMVQTFD